MIQFDVKTIGLINLFEKITRARVKDCFDEGGSLVFVVNPGQAKKAVGEKGKNLEKISRIMKRPIKIIQFSDNIQTFIHNVIYPLKPEVEVTESKVVIKPRDSREKGRILGRDKANFKRLKSIVSKYFKVEIVVA